jgi:hypothetical protein
MKTSLVTTAYFVYLPVIILLTWYVAHTLFKNGKIFMIDIFHGRQDLAVSTNRLFELGFYLLNVGFALLIMEIYAELYTTQRLMEVLSVKLGGYSIYLGMMLFFNLYLFFRGRRISRRREQERTVGSHDAVAG